LAEAIHGAADVANQVLPRIGRAGRELERLETVVREVAPTAVPVDHELR